MADKSMEDLKVGDVLEWARQKRAINLVYVALDDTLQEVVTTMAKANVLTIPIIEHFGHGSRETYYGMIDLRDILHVSMDLIGSGELTEGWKETIEGVLQQKVGELRDAFGIIAEDDKAQVTDSFPEVLRKGFVRTAYHYITVFDGQHACGVLSQNDVLEYISEFSNLLGQKADLPVVQLGITSPDVLKVTEDDSVLKALQIGFAHDKREVCVIDGDGKLLGSINAKALQGLEDLSVLALPVREYKQLHALETPVTIAPTATLNDVIAAVGHTRAVRAYAIDEAGKPLFLMTLNNILRSVVNSGWELNNVKVSDVCKLAHGRLATVQTVDAEITIGEALKELAEHNMLTVPVLRNGKYVGMLDAMDILAELITCMEDKLRGTLRESDHQAAGYQYSITDKEVFAEVSARRLSNLKYTAKDIVPETMTLYDVIVNVFLPNRYHRITVTNAEGKLVNILSQRDISKFIARYPDILGERGDKSIEELGFMRRRVRQVNHRDTMIKAFQVMYHSSSRAVAVVNAKGQLVSWVHVGDLKGLATFYQLRLAICFAKSQVPNPEEYPPDSIPLPMPLTCKKDASLSSVVELMMKHEQRRVYVVDEKGYPTGEVTLTDIYRLLVKPGTDGLFSSQK